MPAMSGAMAGLAASQAAIASQAAYEAQVAQCKMTMIQFNPKTATVAEMRQYSDCVNFVYPKEVCGAAIVYFKVLLVVALIGMCVGVFREWRGNGCASLFDCGMAAFFGLLVPPLVVSVLTLLVWGIIWLFS